MTSPCTVSQLPIGGQVFRSYTQGELGFIFENEIRSSANRSFFIYHEQDCCEHTEIEVTGDISDILDSPITLAECVTNERESENGEEGLTWTFYRIGTAKGVVTLAFKVSSSGYYSESVTTGWRP